MSWQDFESLILASAGRDVSLERLPSCGARFVGKGRIVRQPVPCDFVGVDHATGRGVYLDAKSCELKTRFPVGNADHIPRHQRRFLTAMGRAGAVSGLLVESTALLMVFWLPWQFIDAGLASVEWTDARFVKVGPSNRAIDFGRITAARAAEKARTA